ncbi:MAG TPA: peptidoglycan-binding domain-containing protein [Candidatus Dormibacteraeota bacterium]|nr:peptidoglycan-binding domain-containing protein [Candidatus Dormibacteraeota bacterium]
MKREISEGLETIDPLRGARNGDAQPIVGDSANRDSKQHKAKRDRQTGRNRFSYSDALGRNWHGWHNRDWWRERCNNIVLVTGGYYLLDASYWYPAYGYDPLNSYYDYDGPIYTYGNLLPDQVIANVQGALQNAGYYFGLVTGSLSVETRAALANFQRDQGLIVTGAIDEPTVETLGLY